MPANLVAATAGDMPLVEAAVRRFRLDDEDLRPEQFVVAREGGTVVAFGRIKPYGGGIWELGCVGVLEGARGRGLGRLVVEALVRRFPTPAVWITTDLVTYFERLGFRRTDDAPPQLRAKVARVCDRLRAGVVAMVREGPGPLLDAPRLRLRPVVADDLDALHGLWTDPDVRRFLWDGEAISRDRARAALEEGRASFATRGFGFWLCFGAATGVLAGFAGLRVAMDPAEAELVYALAPGSWGRGLATEAAEAVLRHGFETVGLARIVASTDVPNVASVRVLERLGMTCVGRESGVLGELVCYALARADFTGSRSRHRPATPPP